MLLRVPWRRRSGPVRDRSAGPAGRPQAAAALDRRRGRRPGAGRVPPHGTDRDRPGRRRPRRPHPHHPHPAGMRAGGARRNVARRWLAAGRPRAVACLGGRPALRRPVHRRCALRAGAVAGRRLRPRAGIRSGCPRAAACALRLPTCPRSPTPGALQIFVWPGGDSGEWNWFSEVAAVEDLDRAGGMLTLAGDGRYPLGPGTRFFLLWGGGVPGVAGRGAALRAGPRHR